jgi:hypothetical protein
MIRPERLFVDRQRPLVGRLGLSVAALGVIEPSQIVQRQRDKSMIRAERLFPDRQRPLGERLSVGVAALIVVERS